MAGPRRPIHHRKRDSIGARLTIAFAALAVSHWIEAQTSCSIGEFAMTARRYHTTEIQAGRQTIIAADWSITPEMKTERWPSI